ncbi:AMP-binding protein, partial [Nocardia gipuzkoensis]
VECDDTRLTYRELDCRANQLARLLRDRGARPGRTVGILLNRSIDGYVTLLAVLKTGAAYVPLDPSFPSERIALIAEDAETSVLVTSADLRSRVRASTGMVIEINSAAEEVAEQSTSRLNLPIDPRQACYIIYTSGTTGRPKGVAVSQAGIAHFVRVVTPIYQVAEHDRVYQGLSIAFDFSVEEIWPAWACGATLVAGPTDDRRVGDGLAEFLATQRITVLCCVPTLLSSLDADLPAIHTLLVSGEACPQDLITRWFRPGRRILNAYGPTE